MKCKIVSKITPKVKAVLALKLYEMGFSQKKIAEILETSQAEVSNYINKKRGKGLEICDEIVDEMLKEIKYGKKFSEIICNYCEKLIEICKKSFNKES